MTYKGSESLMSGAEKLNEKIISQATERAEKVLSEAKSRAEEIVNGAEKQADVRSKKILEQAQVEAGERRNRARTIAELDARKAILGAKEELIEDTFRQALARLQNQKPEEAQKIIQPMLLSAVQTGREEIIVSDRDRELFTPEFLAALNKALEKQGKEGKLILSEQTREIMGGFILRSGEVEINSSFDTILRMQRDHLEPAVAAALFGN
ncbi:MAG: V-type ATP synthase subunit E family protein [Bacillota bacterium]|nr:V-type ATP synthase subunit E family protein [Bacillota bacterium]MDW7684382.1 V-type ATP synthase subunit E family protein [Bacillota bacterium]